MITLDQVKISLTKDGNNILSASLIIAERDWIILIGPNGCGKTSVLDAIAGCRTPCNGSIRFTPHNGQIGYAVQEANSGLLPWRSTLSNILLPVQLASGDIEATRKQAESLLSEFGLIHRKDDYPYKLSGGEKQLVNLIRALCTGGDVLLLDEPFAALHQTMRAKARSLVVKYSQEKTTILVSHDPYDLGLRDGRVLTVDNCSVRDLPAHKAKEFLPNE